MLINNTCKKITLSPGDTLNKLAVQYNTSVETILSLNPGIDPTNLRIGQIICVPEQLICPIGSVPYEIKAGDTLSSIATQFFTTEEQILAVNPTLNPRNLKVGQILCITEQKPAGHIGIFI